MNMQEGENAHDITVLMDYGSLTYTPMQNRISPLLYIMLETKNLRSSVRCSRKFTPEEGEDFRIFIGTLAPFVLVWTRPRLAKARAVKAVHPRIPRTIRETTVPPLRVDLSNCRSFLQMNPLDPDFFKTNPREF